jgi:hypothetical protein
MNGIELFESCLKPKQIEKDKFGEVFNPMYLINEMLYNLDKYYESYDKEILIKIQPKKVVKKNKVIKPKINLIIEEETSISENISKNTIKRCPVEFNCMELIFPLLLIYEDINNYDNLIDKIKKIKNNEIVNEYILFNRNSDLDNYIKDITEKKIKIINNFISNYNNLKINTKNNSLFYFTKEDIFCIFISGKKNKHNEINTLNKTENILQTKSDLYIKLKNHQIIGVSIKQSKESTKSNYSVQKMLGENNNKLLSVMRKNYINSKIKLDNLKIDDKTLRSKINSLFYDTTNENIYWKKIRECIEENKINIIKILVSSLYVSDINYDIYEFNGESLIKLNKKINFEEVYFTECKEYYFCKNGTPRRTAKLFYKLIIENKTYRVEIRWKGNIYNSSPQFQIHEEI